MHHFDELSHLAATELHTVLDAERPDRTRHVGPPPPIGIGVRSGTPTAPNSPPAPRTGDKAQDTVEARKGVDATPGVPAGPIRDKLAETAVRLNENRVRHDPPREVGARVASAYTAVKDLPVDTDKKLRLVEHAVNFDKSGPELAATIETIRREVPQKSKLPFGHDGMTPDQVISLADSVIGQHSIKATDTPEQRVGAARADAKVATDKLLEANSLTYHSTYSIFSSRSEQIKVEHSVEGGREMAKQVGLSDFQVDTAVSGGSWQPIPEPTS